MAEWRKRNEIYGITKVYSFSQLSHLGINAVLRALQVAAGQRLQHSVNGGPAEVECDASFDGFFSPEFIRKTFYEQAFVIGQVVERRHRLPRQFFKQKHRMLHVSLHQLCGSLKIHVIAGDGGRGIRIFKTPAGGECYGDAEKNGAEALDAGKAFCSKKGIGFL